MIVDRKGREIKAGCLVKFTRPSWDSDGNFNEEEVLETVRKLPNGELYANNQEEGCFDISFNEMEIVD